jgi:hypothetical protein
MVSVTCDTAAVQGSNYYFEVECSDDGKDGAKVCKNTKYIKGNKSASGATAVPQADPASLTTGSAAQVEDDLSDGPEDFEAPPAVAQEASFYGDDDGEL